MTLRTYILLDRSGSMAAHWSDDLGGINTYVRKLAESDATSSSLVTLVAFDSNYEGSTFEQVRRNAPAHSWVDVTSKDVAPRGGTPLYDAAGKLFNLIWNDNPEKAVVIIMTDGDENTSKEVSYQAAKGYIEMLNNKGFEVVFLGADFKNVEKQSAALGGSFGKTINTSAAMRGATFAKMADSTTAYAMAGTAFNFTAQDKAEAVGDVNVQVNVVKKK